MTDPYEKIPIDHWPKDRLIAVAKAAYKFVEADTQDLSSALLEYQELKIALGVVE